MELLLLWRREYAGYNERDETNIFMIKLRIWANTKMSMTKIKEAKIRQYHWIYPLIRKISKGWNKWIYVLCVCFLIIPKMCNFKQKSIWLYPFNYFSISLIELIHYLIHRPQATEQPDNILWINKKGGYGIRQYHTTPSAVLGKKVQLYPFFLVSDASFPKDVMKTQIGTWNHYTNLINSIMRHS